MNIPRIALSGHGPGSVRLLALCVVLACAAPAGVSAKARGVRPTDARHPTRTTTPPRARAPEAGLQAITQVEGVREYRLANGLQILLVPDDSKPSTTVNMTYRVGSRHEGYGETGMAHLLEHLMFKGSPRHPDVWAEFNQRGLQANGSTWLDRTNYYASFSANDDNLRWYLQWQADAMVNSFIARKDLDSEMTVVRNEMEMGENSPANVLLAKTLSAMYQWHNYGKSTIGARSDVEGVDIARLQAFYRRHYQPDNATLIVSGKFQPAQVLAWVQEFFGAIPTPKEARPALYTLDPVQDGERSVVLRRVGGIPMVIAGYHVMPGAHPDFAAVTLLGPILTDAPAGRLHKQLTEKQLASEVFDFTPSLVDPGFMLVGAQLSSGQNPEAATRALLQGVEGLRSQPITQAELDRARTKWLNGWEKGFADPQHVGVALSEAVAQGDWRVFFQDRDRVKAVTLSQVQRVAEQVLVESNRTVGTYVPTESPVRAPTPSRVNLAEQMRDFKPSAQAAAVAPFEATPAHIDARTLRSRIEPGVDLALLPKATRGQSVKAQWVLRFGDENSLKGWGEVPSALAGVLDKGTPLMDRQAIADRLDALQSQWAFQALPGQLVIQLDSRRDTFPALLTLLTQVLRQANVPEAALQEVQTQALASLDEQRKEPEAVLKLALARHGNAYPRGDVRHARSAEEMESDWKAVTPERVRAFHRAFLDASHSQFSAVGDFDPQAVQQALAAGVQGWAGTVPQARIAQPLQPAEPIRLQLATPDKQNATLVWQLALPLNDRDPDYPAFTLANHLLGSGGNSRLWNRIREKEGLSYGVSSSVAWHPIDANSVWSASAIFAPQNLSKVEVAMQEEIDRALSQGFTQAELDAGRKGLLSFRQLARAQDARLAAALANNLYLQRTLADAARIDAALQALTLDQVNAALRKHLRPERMVRGVAGDFK